MGENITPSWEQREALLAGWSEFLGRFGFDCFATLTFKVPAATGQTALRRGIKFLRTFYKPLKRKPFAFLCAEPHQSGSYHVHGLIRLESLDEQHGYLMRQGMWEQAHKQYGRARFEPVYSADAVERYIAKYLVKGDGLAEHVIIGNP